MTYKVKLEIFEGPLDLLLYLIKKNEVDIYDIPISTITDQYIEYLDMMKSLNLELAGDFILMAATLIHIKSKMLLPIPEEGGEEDEGIDPRAELTRKLLEYRRFKLAAEELNKRLILGRDVFTRKAVFPLEEIEDEAAQVGFADVGLFDLIEAFKDIIKKLPKTYSVDITVDRFRVNDKINEIMEVLEREKSIVFTELFQPSSAKGEIIVTFLAVLELCKLLMIKVNQTHDGVIRIYRAGARTESAPPAPSGVSEIDEGGCLQ